MNIINAFSIGRFFLELVTSLFGVICWRVLHPILTLRHCRSHNSAIEWFCLDFPLGVFSFGATSVFVFCYLSGYLSIGLIDG